MEAIKNAFPLSTRQFTFILGQNSLPKNQTKRKRDKSNVLKSSFLGGFDFN